MQKLANIDAGPPCQPVFAAEPGTEKGNDRWFVVHTKAHAERKAATHLEQQGFGIFFPRLRKLVRHARQERQVLTAMFPGYIFVSLDLGRDRWRSINGTAGVIRVITNGDFPAAVPAGVVETIRSKLGHGDELDYRPELKPGQQVRIFRGPLAEFVGTLETLEPTGRVRVLLAMLGRSVSVVAERDIVEPV